MYHEIVQDVRLFNLKPQIQQNSTDKMLCPIWLYPL